MWRYRRKDLSEIELSGHRRPVRPRRAVLHSQSELVCVCEKPCWNLAAVGKSLDMLFRLGFLLHRQNPVRRDLILAQKKLM
jgi:hypothetical protein